VPATTGGVIARNPRVVLWLGSVISVLTGAGCNWGLTPAQRQQWHADSVRYLAAVRHFERDSFVIDSLARVAPRDSIRRLYATMIKSVAPMPYPQLINCVSRRIEEQFGLRVAVEVERHARNEAFAAASPVDIELMNRRLPAGMAVQVMGGACGFNSGPGPDSIAGVDMRLPPDRPRPPDRPTP
jgi:hypothetical protein